MKLTPDQIRTFDEQGYLFFPNCFVEEEVAVLRSEADRIFESDRREVWREKTGAPRTAFARPHLQRSLPADGASPAPRRAVAAAVR
jgi:ectoine hydroxylase